MSLNAFSKICRIIIETSYIYLGIKLLKHIVMYVNTCAFPPYYNKERDKQT